jgi:trans-aconitate 2-methyltransferase
MWNPEQYERFKSERRQPFDDLLALVERRPDMRVVDLGCGTGQLTRELHETLGARDTVGIDSSWAMLEKSAGHPGESVRFVQADIETFEDEPFDLIFSNAALQWVPDHESLFARLTGLLTSGGQLAVQMPANDDHASHRVAAELAGEFLLPPRPDHIRPLRRYSEVLHELGFRRQHVRLQVYGHTLAATEEVVEWVRGTLLTGYQRQLDGESFERFLEAYRRRLLDVLGERRPYFYTYNRILIWAALSS